MKKLVVIGGGFAGSKIAKALEGKFETILIDSKDYFEFTPGVLRTLVEPEHIKKIQVLHTHYLHKSKIIVGCVTEVGEKYVKVMGKKIYFDYLCICSGSKYDLPIKEQNVVITMRANTLKSYHKKLCDAKNVLIIGGGLVGTELAAEICTHYRGKEITIVHSHDRLIERNPEMAGRYSYDFLTKRGVNVILNEKIEKRRGDKIFVTDKKREIKADIAFLCTGIKPNFDFMETYMKDKLNANNQVIVNEYLQVEGFLNIFSAGDVNSVAIEKTAQNSKRQAAIVIDNILALEKGKELTKYRANQTILVISLGKWNGLLVYNNFVLTGLIPGFLKTLIEKWNMWMYS